MIAGRMNTRIVLLRPEVSTGGLGGERTSYRETATVWAERVRMTGSYGVEVGERFPGYRTEFNIRDAHEVDENWRVRVLGGHLYTVTNITPHRERGMLTLCCDRVNL